MDKTIDFSQASPEAVNDKLLQAYINNGNSPLALMEMLQASLKQLPDYPAACATSLLEQLIAAGCTYTDKAAEAIMETNPSKYEESVFKVAEGCRYEHIRFGLVRSVFRRFPGRYRPYMLKTGRELLHSGSPDLNKDTIIWLIWKFGAELVPDLVAYIQGPTPLSDKIAVLNESVKCLGRGSVSIITAAIDTNIADLVDLGQESLRRLGINAE